MYMPDNSTNAALMATDIFGIIHVTGLQIIIDGKIFNHYESFELEQTATAHHHFKLILQHDILETVQDHSLEEARDLLGKRISVTFKYKNFLQQDPEREFIGVIMQVGFTSSHGHKGSIVLSGQSPTALLDAAPHIQSFGGAQPTSLFTIADTVIRQGLGETKFDINIQPTYTGNLPYSCQYNETHYNYLCRMAAAYGEWFFYDGQVLHFGKPATADPIRLIYGKDTGSVMLQMNAQHVNRDQSGYNSSANSLLASGHTPVTGLDELGMHAYNTGKKIFTSASLATAALRAVTDTDIEAAQKSSNGSVAATSFTLKGTTTVPFLYPGCLIEMNFRKPESSDVKYFSRLLVIEVSHKVDVKGNYKGSFTAIPSDTDYLPQANYSHPHVYPQLATVLSNANGQGRVQVQFNWQRGQHSTDFIRVATPDAGSSDAVGTNRGFVFIPEPGDQVMVNFTEGHPDRPFVQSAMFHGGNGAGGYEQNHKKSIITRSGSVIQFDDTDGKGSITVTDASGNRIYLDGQGNITITASTDDVTVNAPETMTFNAKNLIMNVIENISISAGMNISTVAGMDIMESAGDNMHHFAINDLKVAATNITHIASENVEHHAKKIEKTAEEIKVESTKESITINAADKVELKSAKKTKLF